MDTMTVTVGGYKITVRGRVAAPDLDDGEDLLMAMLKATKAKLRKWGEDIQIRGYKIRVTATQDVMHDPSGSVTCDIENLEFSGPDRNGGTVEVPEWNPA